jgi:hypothetical protein
VKEQEKEKEEKPTKGIKTVVVVPRKARKLNKKIIIEASDEM